jgi:hypothetical protein
MNKTLMMLLSGGLLLIILGLVLSIGAKISTDTKTNSATDSVTTLIYNETITSTLHGTTYPLSHTGDVESPANIASVIVTNASEGSSVTYNSTNYAYDSTSGTITFRVDVTTLAGNSTEANGTAFNVTYSYTAYGRIWAIGTNNTAALDNLSTYQDTIAVVIAAVVIITLLLAGFGGWLYFKSE